MNISGLGAPSAQVQASAASTDKRAQLQTLLLRKSLEMQQQETAALARQADGKGQHIDLRV